MTNVAVVVDVRAARRADLDGIARVLSLAFLDDPVMSWMLPAPSRRGAGLARFFGTVTRRQHLGFGGVEMGCDPDGTVRAAALWDPPDRWRTSSPAELTMLPGLARAFGTRLVAAARVSETLQRAHPEEPHWYLAAIGTDPAVRGGGYGAALLRSRLDRCDAEACPAYLESSNPVNISYYQRFGFEVLRELALPDDCPPVWPMWRTPR